MIERDKRDIDEIEFDFFDDPPTREASSSRETAVAPPKRRRRIPTRPPSGGNPQLLRLAGLILGVIGLAVVLVLVVNSCRGDQKRAEYENYMQSVGAIGSESARIGQQLNQLVATPGKKIADLRQELDGLREQQAQMVRRAEELDPPGPLREQHDYLIDALRLRVSGLNGLAGAFGQVGNKTVADAAGRDLAEQADRLVASDVVYEDFFRAGSQGVLREQDVTGVAVPESRFVRAVELTSPASWSLIVQRLAGSGETGGLHGNQISGVVVQPEGKTLAANGDNTVKASDRLAFDVLVKNSGDSQEAQVKVNLVIQQSPNPIRLSQTIPLIDPGVTKRVTFRDIGQPSFGTRTFVKVSVEPVVGEQNRNNNSAEYQVIFTL